jgi:oligoendopeptidase F
MAKERASVPAHLRWRTEDIFATEAEWEALYASVSERLDFSCYEGKLGNPDNLLSCFRELNAVTKDLSHLGVYAFMKHDEDTRNADYTALSSRVETLEVKLASSTAFLTPELTALPEQTLQSFIADPRFADYDYTLRGILREKPHVLSRETEEVLALGGKMLGGFHDIFGMLDNADFPVPTVTVEGKPVSVTHGTYGVLLRSPDRRVRKKVFEAYYKAYIGLINTITATYAGNVEKDVFLARARRYESCLDRALSAEDVSPVVYENLLESVNEALPLLHRYFADRKKALGYRELHMYDLYTTLVENAELKLDYEEAYKVVKEGLAPLGEKYAALLDEAHDNGWIDVEETAGKRSGAYSISVYGIPHPYVLLNYQPTTSDVFTIAHELGHAMHSYHSERTQPQEKADYKIFVAEVASTVNEVLLLRHLLRTTTDAKLKKYLLSYYMDTINGTLFRQTQFAEFEYLAHKMAEDGEPLTRESLNDVYYKLNQKYYGPAVVSDKEIAYEWARIPHFYRAFYVYKYATGIIAAVSIVDRIEKLGAPAVEDYFRFLSSGGSDSPVELLKLAGVDLTKKDAFRAAMQSFEDALTEFESIE